jgi:hypothetical protein
VVPPRVYVLVVPAAPELVDGVIQLGQHKGSSAGWTDASPWPGYTSNASEILTVTDQTHFTMNSDTSLPTGVTAPSLMVWNQATTSFEVLDVASVSGSGPYSVVLNAAPSLHLDTSGQRISPAMSRHALVSASLLSYFDELGPGEVLADSDPRYRRAHRWPEPHEEYPQRFSQAVCSRIGDALGGTAADVLLATSSVTPAVPSQISTGPSLLVPGHFAIYELT